MEAGLLRHRIDIQKRINQQDPVSGAVTPKWVNLHVSVPAQIEPLTAKELIAAAAVQSELIARVTIRYKPGLKGTMRIKFGTRILNPTGFLPDKNSGLRFLTALCSEGVDQG